MKDTKVINFVGGPGVGKSTAAGILFGEMKKRRMSVEYAPEFAKELTWKNSNNIDDQIYVAGRQHNLIYSLLGQVDYIITDSPIFLGAVYSCRALNKYGDASKKISQELNKLLVTLHFAMNSTTILVNRIDRPYDVSGRNQSYEEARLLDQEIKEFMNLNRIDYVEIEKPESVLELMSVELL